MLCWRGGGGWEPEMAWCGREARPRHNLCFLFFGGYFLHVSTFFTFFMFFKHFWAKTSQKMA